MIASTSVLRLCSDVRHRNVGGEMVVLSQKRGEVMVLNEIGAVVFGSLDGTTSMEAIAARVVAAFDVTAEQALADVLEFAGRLVELGVAEAG